MSDVRRWLTVSLGVGVVLAMADACIIGDPEHCNTTGEDCGMNMVCDPCQEATPTFNGCVAEGTQLDPLGCAAAESDTTSVDPTVGVETNSTTEPPVTTTVDVDTTVTTSESDTSTTTGEPVPCMEDEDCMEDPAHPFCYLMQCVDCSQTPSPDMECAEADPTKPLCANETCVQCTASNDELCGGETPVCDTATNSCVRCSAHDECENGAACNLFTGACLPADAVVRVGPGQAFTTIGAAVNSFGAGTEGTIIVHDGSYNETVTVDNARTLAFLSNGAVIPQWVRTSGATAPQLTVLDATVLMDGIEMSSNSLLTQPAMRVSTGMAWVDRARIVGNGGGGISVEMGAELTLRNSFLANDPDVIELNVASSTALVLYSTIGANLGTTTGLLCDGSSVVTVRNSIIVSRSADPEVSCTNLTATYTAAELLLAGDGNEELMAIDTGWFQAYNGGDLHLTPSGDARFAGIAQWQAGGDPDDPLVDIDLEPRMAMDGAMEHAGADVP